MWSSDQTPSWPGKPWPARCTCAAQVMTRPKPPSARIVSQWNSSSDSLPSGWLWQLVSGASMKRFFQAGPRVNDIGSRKSVIGGSIFQFEGQAGAVGQPPDQRLAHGGGGGPATAGLGGVGYVAGKAERGFGEDLGGRAVARVLVARHSGADGAPVLRLGDEEDVVVAALPF